MSEISVGPGSAQGIETTKDKPGTGRAMEKATIRDLTRGMISRSHIWRPQRIGGDSLWYHLGLFGASSGHGPDCGRMIVSVAPIQHGHGITAIIVYYRLCQHCPVVWESQRRIQNGV